MSNVSMNHKVLLNKKCVGYITQTCYLSVFALMFVLFTSVIHYKQQIYQGQVLSWKDANLKSLKMQMDHIFVLNYNKKTTLFMT